MNHRGDADPDLGHAEHRVMRRDADVAGGRDLEPATEAPAGQAGDDRRRKLPHGLAEVTQAADEAFGGLLIERRHLLDVGAADHAALAFAGQDHRADAVVGGQMLDLAAEGRFAADGAAEKLDETRIRRMQAMKTGALISCAVESGAILGRAPQEGRTGLRGYARDVGLAFQIADDILDAEGDEALVGKKLHKDGAAGKETFLSLLGMDRARAQAQMLVEQAIAHLKPYGAEADLLRDIARYTLERDR